MNCAEKVFHVFFSQTYGGRASGNLNHAGFVINRLGGLGYGRAISADNSHGVHGNQAGGR